MNNNIIDGLEFYQNQYAAANQIIGHFKAGKKFVLMRALEQSGKTGTAQSLIQLMNTEIENGFFGNVLVVYLTHLSCVSVKQQTEKRLDSWRRELKKLNPKFSKILNWHRNDVKKQNFIEELTQHQNNADCTLVISDECHEAISTDGLIGCFFKQKYNITEESFNNSQTWPPKFFVLSMSATPYDNAIINGVDVNLLPGENYFGAEQLLKSNRFHDTDGIKLSKNDFEYLKKVVLPEVVLYYNSEYNKQTPGIVYLRAETSKDLKLQEALINEFKNKYNNIKISVEVYGSNEKNTQKLFELQKLIPAEIKEDYDCDIHFAIIKQTMKAGDTIDTGYCLGWYETSGHDEKVDSVSQRTGRCFGYKGEHSKQFKKDQKFPIFSYGKKLQKQVDWYKEPGQAKNPPPGKNNDGVITKVKNIIINEFVFENKADAIKKCKELYPDAGVPVVSSVGDNVSLAEAVLTDKVHGDYKNRVIYFCRETEAYDDEMKQLVKGILKKFPKMEGKYKIFITEKQTIVSNSKIKNPVLPI